MNETNKKISVVLPFAGFYGTIHEDNLNREIEMEDDLEASEALNDKINWKATYINYSKDYAKQFFKFLTEESAIAFEWEFETLDSPKEYNFATDRIFCFVDYNSLKKLYDLTMNDNARKLALRALIKKQFTSYDGFISSYENELNEWPMPEDFDHNEWLTFLQAWFEYDDKHDDRELYFMDDCFPELIWEEEKEKAK